MKFDQSFLQTFPGDSRIYAEVQATPVAGPEVLIWSDEAARLIDLDPKSIPKEELAQIFSGNKLYPGMQSYATRYGGHQFGVWAGQLGDGRALSLGETINSRGERWEIQLKGAGVTPYSRRGDGRAVLRSSLREFLCSEAMFYLGIPTTRALCCVTTGEKVVRDMFYDGNPEAEEGAITTRLSPSFLRLGHFQILAADRNSALLEKLMQYAIRTHFPEIDASSKAGYTSWFHEVCRRTAELMVHWTRVGFVHGVMNTDNLSILGLTIDYGPYGWMDIYDPNFTPNTTDAEHGRYRFSHQPQIAFWNLQRFSEALMPVIADPEAMKAGLELYVRTYNEGLKRMMGKKLGLAEFGEGSRVESDFEILNEMDNVLRAAEVDMTIFYRTLSRVRAEKDVISALEILRDAFYAWPLSYPAEAKWREWLKAYLARAEQDSRPIKDVQREMNQTNPYYIMRNYLAQEALDEIAKGSREKLDQLMRALKTPYEENENTRPFFKRMPDWARNRAGCSALSCSS